MKIYGVSVVQNEADVVRDSIEWALRFCDRIWVWDLGSTDGTWDVLRSLKSDRVVSTRHDGIRFKSALKGCVFNEARAEMEEGAWVYILDADEFVEGDVQGMLKQVEQEEDEVVGGWQANFFPTQEDLARLEEVGEKAWTSIPLAERLRHYRVEWFEWRFVRYIPGLVWDTSGMHSCYHDSKGRALRKSSHHFLIRHYRYRSPSQVAMRFTTRKESPVPGYGQFKYEVEGLFPKCVREGRKCRLWERGLKELVLPDWEVRKASNRVLARRVWRRLLSGMSLIKRWAPFLSCCMALVWARSRSAAWISA